LGKLITGDDLLAPTTRKAKVTKGSEETEW